MELGIFCRIFARPSLVQTLDALAASGLKAVQFHLTSAGLPELPDEISPQAAAAIRQSFEARGLRMAAVSGTYNMIHPDPLIRQQGLSRLKVLAAACPGLGTALITLCSGTRDPVHMWHRHPNNTTPAAWRDLLDSLTPALEAAEANRVTLAFEPEPGNVIDRARKGRRLLDELRSPYLKVVMDAANLIHPGELGRMGELFDEAFDLLGGDVALAHAKDLAPDGRVVAAGKGLVDYDRFLRLLHAVGFTGAVILHSLDESEVPGSLEFLMGKRNFFT
jgi:sugar phosphate isomerase/epimerase